MHSWNCILHFLQETARNICEQINQEYDIVQEALLQLQSNALQRLRERDKYEKTGIGTLHVKISEPSTEVITIEVNVKLDDASGVDDVITQVSHNAGCNPTRWGKLLYKC